MSETRSGNKKSLKLYYDMCENAMEEFNDEELGELFRAIFKYEMYGENTEFADRGLKMMFKQFKNSLDMNMEKYKLRCEQNKKNATKNIEQPF